MNDSIIQIALDMQELNNMTVVYLKKGDTARKIIITLSDGGFPYEIGETCYAVLSAKKPDGNTLFNYCTIDGNKIIYDVTSQTTAAAGKMRCEIRLIGADNAVVNTASFLVIVEDTVTQDEVPESSSEFTALTQLMSEVIKITKEEGAILMLYGATEETLREIRDKIGSIDSIPEGQIVTADILRQQNQILMAIAAGNASSAFIDNTFQELLDGSNTTSIFQAWWPLSDNGTDTRYARLERFGRMLANAWAEKTYTLRGYAGEVSSDDTLTPMDDLAGRSSAVLATDTSDGGEDWAENDPMTWYIRANALSLADGSMDVKAIEGEDGFDIGGDLAPVYRFSLALWRKQSYDGSYETDSWRTTKAAGYAPYAGDVAPDNTKRVLTWLPCFGGSLTADGKLTSGAGKKCYNLAAATSGLTAARKWDAYEGLWSDCDTEFLLDQWKLRHFKKENSGVLEGCTSYNYQYKAAMAETGVKRVLLTTAQAANLVPGSTVSVGDATTNTNLDRGQTYMRDIADLVRITSIANVTVDGTEYAAVNLELDATINVTATTYISTMPWHRGSTEAVPGHKDGCVGSLTSGKYPARIAGVEVLDGAYATGLDPLYNVTANETSGFDYAVHICRNSENLSGSITENHVDTGLKITGITNTWYYVKAFVVNKLGVVLPRLFGGSSAGWYKSAFYGATSAGVRCPWRFGGLYHGGNAGLACENGDTSPGYAAWTGSPRLSGSGKKRGEFTA